MRPAGDREDRVRFQGTALHILQCWAGKERLPASLWPGRAPAQRWMHRRLLGKSWSKIKHCRCIYMVGYSSSWDGGNSETQGDENYSLTIPRFVRQGTFVSPCWIDINEGRSAASANANPDACCIKMYSTVLCSSFPDSELSRTLLVDVLVSCSESWTVKVSKPVRSSSPFILLSLSDQPFLI